jgi:hypothetical protein
VIMDVHAKITAKTVKIFSLDNAPITFILL